MCHFNSMESIVLQPFRRIELIVHIVIFVLYQVLTPGSSEACEVKVPCPRTQHRDNVPRLRGEEHYLSLKILRQAGFETARQASTLAKHHVLRHCTTFMKTSHRLSLPRVAGRFMNDGIMIVYIIYREI